MSPPNLLKRALSRSMAAILMATAHYSVRAGECDIFYLFEDQAKEGVVGDSSGNGYDMGMGRGSRLTTADKKFGSASLIIGGANEGESGVGWSGLLNRSGLEPLKEPLSKFTIAMWVKASETVPFTLFWRVPVDTRRPGFFQLSYIRGKALYFEVSGAGEGERSANVLSPAIHDFVDGEWTHFAMTFKEGEVIFYVNGIPLGQPRTIPLTKVAAAEATLTSIMGASGLRPGSLVDDFAFFGDAVLDEAAIQKIHDDGLESYLQSAGNHP